MEISYSRSVKLSQDYNSKSISLSVTDTVAAGETAEQAFERIKTFVLAKLQTELNAQGASKQASPTQAPQKSQSPNLGQPRAFNGASEKQIGRMLALSKQSGLDLQALDELVQSIANGKRVNFKTKQNTLTKDEYNAICGELEAPKAPDTDPNDLPF